MPLTNPSPESGKKIVVALLSQRGWLTEEKIRKRLPGGELVVGDLEFSVEDTSRSDVVVIQNYLRYDRRVRSRRGFIWKWDLEPIVANKVVRAYDRVYTHLDIPGEHRVVTAPPILDWWIDKTFDELAELSPPAKTRSISAIASTKDWIPGHRLRNEFVSLVEGALPEIDVFGHGREKQLNDKWDGLAPYRYSIAVENTSKRDYWTEKIADCFLSYTVPFYFGATNIADYFPEGSFVWLPLDDQPRALQIIKDTLSTDSWEERLPALHEARRRMLYEYSLYGQLSNRIAEERESILAAPIVHTKVHGRRVKKGGWIRGVGLAGNLKALLRRRRARRGEVENPFYHP